MSGVLCAFSNSIGVGPSFTPVDHTYTSGTAATETIPTGASQVTITAWGPGGDGNYVSKPNIYGGGVSNIDYGGGSGGYSIITLNVSGQGGNTFTYTIGVSLSSNTTIANATYTSPVFISANHGVSGIQGGSGGAASGGSTNIIGNSGGAFANGGNAPNGGAGGIQGTGENGGTPGGGGAGGNADNPNSGIGGRGKIIFSYI